MNISSHLSRRSTKVVVVQRGARHRYAIPRLLEHSGVLAALYTDSCIHSPAGRLAARLPAWVSWGRQMKALVSRNPAGIPRERVFASDRLLLSSLSRGLVRPDLSPVYRRWGLQGASIVYSMYGEDLLYLAWAKSQGAKIVVDVFISPLSNQVVFDEQSRFDVPSHYRIDGSECVRSETRGIGAYAPLADILLCPSEWVAEGVRVFMPEYTHKIRVVPYGSSILPRKQGEVVPGRILFAGRDPLRKGLPYLAEATNALRQSGMELDVRVAGLGREDCKWFSHHQELNFLGLVEMARMGDELSHCDAFVLPSLSEGQAGVVLEALSYGCPVIATRESGVDFSHGGNGLLVPARDAVGLANAISTVVRDRPLREKLSSGGREFFSRNFSLDMWQNRLADVVRELGSGMLDA